MPEHFTMSVPEAAKRRAIDAPHNMKDVPSKDRHDSVASALGNLRRLSDEELEEEREALRLRHAVQTRLTPASTRTHQRPGIASMAGTYRTTTSRAGSGGEQALR